MRTCHLYPPTYRSASQSMNVAQVRPSVPAGSGNFAFANIRICKRKVAGRKSAVLNLRSEGLPEVGTRAERVRAHHLCQVGLDTLLPSL